jgi:RNA polymerase sigma-70 factor (ECF subfamily)
MRGKVRDTNVFFSNPMEPEEQAAEDLDTDRLIVRVQEGHKDEFAKLYTRYFDRVYSYLRGIFKDPHEAEDAAQEVFIKVMAALPGFKQRSEPFRAWLFVIVRNHAIDELRKRGRVELVEPAEIEALAGVTAASLEVTEEAERAVLSWLSDSDLTVFAERLPLVHRQVLVLRFVFDLPAARIGEILGLSADNVRAIQSRAIIFLRKRLAAMGRTPVGNGDRIEIAARIPQAYVLRKRRFTLKD